MDTRKAVNAYQEHDEEVREFNRRLMERAATDMEFRQKLINDPRAALTEFSGREVSQDVNVVFVENKADATIVLPDPVNPEAELSEEDLEAVAGGDVLGGIALTLAISGATLWLWDEVVERD